MLGVAEAVSRYCRYSCIIQCEVGAVIPRAPFHLFVIWREKKKEAGVLV